MTFDVELLGDCDVIISELCQRLGGTWNGLLDDFEIPRVNRGLSSSEISRTVEEQPEIETETSGGQENVQVNILWFFYTNEFTTTSCKSNDISFATVATKSLRDF